MIIIISSPQDLHAQAVMRALDAAGAAPHQILDLSEFPVRMDLGIALATGGDSKLALRLADGTRLDLRQVTAFWWRRPQPFGLPAEMTDPVHRSFAQQESDLAFRGLWQCTQALWVNDVNRDAAASHKPWQLDVARDVGLSIPRTLITNCPEDVERFVAEADGEVIYKAFLASALAWRETRLLRAEDRQALRLVRFAPVIFQRYVPARLDLRVTVIGERILAAAAETAKTDYPADIRMNPSINWAPYRLPDEVAHRLLLLMRRLGLEYGAVDFRVTPDDEHVFLEVNPAGQFLFIENACGLKISTALAEHLAAAPGRG
jgi:glutathione synthase/RimK-type ligase-like ATP-grasp enzyme